MMRKTWVAFYLFCTLIANTQGNEINNGSNETTFNSSYRASLSLNLAHLDAESRLEATDTIDWASADQQSFRLMLHGQDETLSWELHLKSARQSFSNALLGAENSAFRYTDLSDYHIDEQSPSRTTRWFYEIDRFAINYQLNQHTLSLGRQAIDFGSGRIWQAFNVFGAFRPTDLDTVYKQGIDAFQWRYYPESLTSMTFTYVLSAKDSTFRDSLLLAYQSLVGETWQMGLLAGQVLNQNLIGLSLENDYRGLGYRGELVFYQSRLDDNIETHGIVGIDYQWENGLFMIAEMYYNDFAAKDASDLLFTTNPLLEAGIFTQLSRMGLGVVISKELTPLTQGSLTTLFSPLSQGQSTLHQLAFTTSLSDNTELVFGLLVSTGPGYQQGNLRSEYGFLPSSLSMRVSHYF